MQRRHSSKQLALKPPEIVLHRTSWIVKRLVSEALLISPQRRQQFRHDVRFGDVFEVRGAGLQEAALEVEDRPFLREDLVGEDESCAVVILLVR